MAINFIPNDPLAVAAVPMRQQDASPNRPPSRAGFTFFGQVPQKPYDFGTDEFLFWQCREGALSAVEMWESIIGSLPRWARSANPKKLDLSQNFDDPEFTGGQKLNAFYDGEGLRFFIFDDVNPRVFSGVSTDTVSHETGHALLDTVRSELFGSLLPEIGGFHEAFADCTALMTALSDPATRQALLAAAPDLGSANFVEANSEYLSDAIRTQFGNVAASLPRRALNQFQWQLPSTLPPGRFDDPPDLLSREVHSFSRVFTGCFYDTLRGIFTSSAAQDEAALMSAASTAYKLLVSAVASSPQNTRYFQTVGRGMALADQQANGGVNVDAITAAFAGHNIILGVGAMLAPAAALAGKAPDMKADVPKLAAATARDIKERIRAGSKARLQLNPLKIAGSRVLEVLHQREVPLDDVDKRLKGVVGYAPEPVLVGSSGERAALLGVLPEPSKTIDEVHAFVESLLRNGRITAGKKAGILAPSGKTNRIATHAIVSKAGKKVLTRIRFVCGCGG